MHQSAERGLWVIGSADRCPVGASGLQIEIKGASGLKTMVCGGIGSAYRRPLSSSGLQTEFYGSIGYADRDQLWALRLQTEVCSGIGSADRGLCGIRSAQRDLWGLNSADRGLWWHRVCRQRSAGGIGSANRGPLGASELQTEVPWGHRVCKTRSAWGGFGSADRGLWEHCV